VVLKVFSVVQAQHWLVMAQEVLRTSPGGLFIASSDLTFFFKKKKKNSYFAAYEVTKKALTPPGSSPSELNLGAVILAGGTAGVAMWTLAIPPDVRTVHSSLNFAGSRIRVLK
jgi:hypothetical protein